MTEPGRHAAPGLPLGRRILVAVGLVVCVAIGLGLLPVLSLFLGKH